MEVQATPEKKDSKSFSYFLEVPISLVFLCCQWFLWYRRALVSSSSNMNGGRSSFKSAQNENVEGVAILWKESYLSALGFRFRRMFFLDFSQRQLFCEESKPFSVSWLDVHLWDSHKILDSSRSRTSASHDTRQHLSCEATKSPELPPHTEDKFSHSNKICFLIEVRFVSLFRLWSCFILSCLFPCFLKY